MKRDPENIHNDSIRCFAPKKAPPLSFRQKRLWFLDRLTHGRLFNREIQVLRLKGNLDSYALEQSWREALKRQPFFHFHFPIINGQPSQEVCHSPQSNWIFEDLQESACSDQESLVPKKIREEMERPLDLERNPVWKSILWRLNPEEHVWMLMAHRIASDHRSFEILFQEISSFYQSFIHRRPMPSETGLSSIPDHIWRAESERGECPEELAYWKRRLEGAPEILELPSDRLRPAVRSLSGASCSIALDPDLTQSLQSLGRQENATMPVVLLASLALLLHRYTSQEDVLLGLSLADWFPPEVEGLIGPFTNTVVLRNDFSRVLPFRDFLRQTNRTIQEAHSHRKLPFERLVEETGAGRSLDHSPLIQVKVSFEENPLRRLYLKGVQTFPLDVALDASEFDLEWIFGEDGEKWHLRVRYNAELFDAERIERMLEHFQNLLRGIRSRPEEVTVRLPLLDSKEQRQLVVEWNDTTRSYPANTCLHQLFEAQAERTPEAVAVVSQTGSLTYRELNLRANCLAHRLIAEGVGPEKLVALCTDRSLDMVVGLFAILKAGGAYVPMHLSYPADRLSFIFEDAGVSVLLTQKRCLEHLPKNKSRILCLDEALAPVEVNPKVEVTASNLAYVIYTSGSTGRPKGVAIEHHGPVAFAHWAREFFSFEELGGVLASTSICFDLSVFEIFVPLSWGGTVILAENALQLPTLSAAEKVVLINTVPSGMAELIRMGGVPASVRTVNMGGEALSAALVQQIYQIPGIQRVNDLYGPTEDTVYSTYARRTPSGPAMIGRPISNTQAYVLDRHLQLVPVGVPGELHLGGDGLARGYLHRPELTAEKFIPNPWSKTAGARLYKTGDWVRYRRDGNLEYLGRMDHQVKIRGFRIELGEIEARLRQYQKVRECRVMVMEDSPGEKNLVAYIVPHQQPPPSSQEIRQWLKQSLPEYMIPSAFIWLKEFPLTPNGKVDRKALPAPDRSGSRRECEYTAPRNETERKLTAIWQEVLGIQKIGIQDNFFDLGGHSLLAVRLFERLEQDFGKKLPLGALFQAPTIERLAEELGRQDSAKSSSLLVGIQPTGSKPPMFWVHTLGGDGGGGFFYYRKLAELLGPDQPSYGIRADDEPFERIEEMASRYIEEMRSLQPQGPYFLGGFCFGGNVAFEMARQLTAKGHKIAFLALLECPLNGTTRWSWELASIIAYARELQQWLRTLAKLGPKKGLLRVRKKLKFLHKKVALLFGLPQSGSETVPFGEVIDLSNYPKRYVRHAEIHWQALMSYTPKPYKGRITLFRAHSAPFPKRDVAWGWDTVAAEGVVVKWIPGAHNTLFIEPHVHVLAEQLKACLEEAHASKRDASSKEPIRDSGEKGFEDGLKGEILSPIPGSPRSLSEPVTVNKAVSMRN